MTEPDATVILIPACNEGARIGPVLDGVRRIRPDDEIVVIDDGSEDDTALVAEARGATVLRHPFNLGYGSAMHTGYLYAQKRNAARVVQLDADGQHDPESVPDLLECLATGADVVIGSRYRCDDPPKTSTLRLVGSRLFSWIVSTWTGVQITDPTSGFQAMSRRALDEVALDGFPEDYPDADVLILLARRGLELAEVPVRMHGRSGGKSMHRGGRAAYYAYKMALTLSLMPVRRRSPFRSSRVLPASTTGS